MSSAQPTFTYVETSITSQSPTGLIAEESDTTNGFHSRLTRLLNAIDGAPCSLEVVATVISGLTQVENRIDDADPRIHGLLGAAEGLQESLRRSIGNAHGSAPSTLKGKKTKHPIWVAFGDMGFTASADNAAFVLAGCAVLRAFRLDQPIPKSVAHDIVQLRASDPLSDAQLHHLLWHDLPEEAELENWVYTLRRLWREVIREYGGNQEAPQPPFHHSALLAHRRVCPGRRGVGTERAVARPLGCPCAAWRCAQRPACAPGRKRHS